MNESWNSRLLFLLLLFSFRDQSQGVACIGITCISYFMSTLCYGFIAKKYIFTFNGLNMPCLRVKLDSHYFQIPTNKLPAILTDNGTANQNKT